MRNLQLCSYHISKLEALYCRDPIWIYKNLKPGTQESILSSVFTQKNSTTYQNCCRITKFKTSKEHWINFKKRLKRIFKYGYIISYITLVFDLVVGIVRRPCKHRVNATAYGQKTDSLTDRETSSLTIYWRVSYCLNFIQSLRFFLTVRFSGIESGSLT